MDSPQFLIIGAMKAGTTTLFRDLVDHPHLFLPQEKEPEVLVRHASLEAMRQDYRSLFAPARSGQMLGEASTAYTKQPSYPCPASIAFELCGPNLKLIYLQRDPIKRIVSQYKHEYGLGLITDTLNHAVVNDSRFVDYSRYEWQLKPWLNRFGLQNILLLSFEEYIKNRLETVQQVCRFLGVDADLAAIPMESRAFNSSDNKPTAARGIWRDLVASRFYQRSVKPHVPWKLRDTIASLVLPKVDVEAGDISPEVRQILTTRLNLEPYATPYPSASMASPHSDSSKSS